MYHPHEKTVDDVFDMMRSLQRAIKEAGGTVVVTPEFIETTTVKQLMLMLATNKVRFVFREETQKFPTDCMALPDPVEYLKRTANWSFDDDADY